VTVRSLSHNGTDAPPSPRRYGVVTLLVVALVACAGTNAVRQDVVGSNGYQSGDAALTSCPSATGPRYTQSPAR